MNTPSRSAVFWLAVVALSTFLVGFLFGRSNQSAAAETSFGAANRQVLDTIYGTVFSRPADGAGANFHLNRDILTVLSDMARSPEHKHYSVVFKALKSYEDALRAPGTLTESDRRRYLEMIDSALGTFKAWAEALPQQEICRGTVRADQAHQSIIEAYGALGTSSMVTADRGLFNAYGRVGSPATLVLPDVRCIVPTPSLGSTSSPQASSGLTPTPSVSASPTPSYSPSPTTSPIVS